MLSEKAFIDTTVERFLKEVSYVLQVCIYLIKKKTSLILTRKYYNYIK